MFEAFRKVKFKQTSAKGFVWSKLSWMKQVIRNSKKLLLKGKNE